MVLNDCTLRERSRVYRALGCPTSTCRLTLFTGFPPTMQNLPFMQRASTTLTEKPVS